MRRQANLDDRKYSLVYDVPAENQMASGPKKVIVRRRKNTK